MSADVCRTSTRRHFLASQAFGLGSLAAAWLLAERRAAAEPPKPLLEKPHFDLAPKPADQPARATAMISLFMQGGPSHLDLFDPKPALAQLDGRAFPESLKYDNAAQASAKTLASPWTFAPRGECGMELSELLPCLGEVADEITLIRSMHTGVNNHGQSIRALQNGRILGGRPALGSWLTYALGAETRDLPAYVALTDPGQVPVLGVENWSNGFLPSLYQGTVVRPRVPRILDLDPPDRLAGPPQQRYLAFLAGLNRHHLAEHAGEDDLEARISSFELAARMQSAASEALDLSGESRETRELYGLDNPATADYGTRCLIARRLVERGVRFVQVFTQNQFWDHHNRIRTALPAACRKTDRPAAALVKDLKRRGLLDTTVVHWGGEMGRLPVIQNDAGPDKVGRDHNTYGFSMWLAGGGIRRGCVYGATDELGHRAVDDVVNHFDYHATLLHLFGLTPSRTVWQQNGRERSLLQEQPGRIVEGILA